METGTVVETPSSKVAGTGSKCPWAPIAVTRVELPPPVSPWGRGSQQSVAVGNNAVSLEDVMSEQLARQLQQETVESAVINDFLLAQMLQYEYDKEYDKCLKKQEDKFNGQSKVSISLSNYRITHPYIEDDEDSSDDEPFEPTNKSLTDRTQSFNKQGIRGKGKNITTKHDATICGRRNASRVMEFPPDFESGDVRGDDFKLPNHAYNSLKQHSITEEKRRTKLHEKKEHSTAEMAVDPRTRLIMYKLVNGEVLDSISGVISTGKESVVFHAHGGTSTSTEIPVPNECALKVFKTTLNEFKTREKYVNGDYRFSKDEFKKHNPRKIIKMWAEKEATNLRKMRRANVPCPDPVLLRKHVLVMSFIGRDQISAPKLKDVTLTDLQWESAYQQCLQLMKKLHDECLLIHADLSEYNLLWYDGKVWVIDVSQAVDRAHPNAYQFLLRDCTNISQFFEKRSVPNVLDPYELFNDISGMELTGEGKEFLAQVEDYEKNEELIANDASGKEYPFDFFFDKATKERQKTTSSSSSSSSQGATEQTRQQKPASSKKSARKQRRSSTDADPDNNAT
ncbi:serine/threonine-protein kinase RIO3-like isoform X2 [Tubulanus polymorphus]|uniref:serine/threonine-protein kinase RIO3-like isoform X2 n=1 Tax=Tubulanus polymorphus TaxID=672921 RepID=UPI003DA39498